MRPHKMLRYRRLVDIPAAAAAVTRRRNACWWFGVVAQGVRNVCSCRRSWFGACDHSHRSQRSLWSLWYVSRRHVARTFDYARFKYGFQRLPKSVLFDDCVSSSCRGVKWRPPNLAQTCTISFIRIYSRVKRYNNIVWRQRRILTPIFL